MSFTVQQSSAMMLGRSTQSGRVHPRVQPFVRCAVPENSGRHVTKKSTPKLRENAERSSHEMQEMSTLACRRTMLLGGAAAMWSAGQNVQSALADPEVEVIEEASPAVVEAVVETVVAEPIVTAPQIPMETLNDPILAYEFQTPLTKLDGTPLNWLTSRAPERYSSAAPITADARQRFVYEKADFKGPFNVSVSVGPIPPLLAEIPQEEWKPIQVVNAVLTEKSTARVTSGQRVTLSIVEEVEEKEIDGTRYWLYEHVRQGSPTPTQVVVKETYRHNYAVTAMRGDYLYTLNLGAPDAKWDEVSAGFEAAMKSFRLKEPGNGYIAPEVEPWHFW